MAQRKLSIRRLFHDYCEIVKWSQPGACPVAGCSAPAVQSEYGAICLAGHVTDGQGAVSIGRTIDLALAIVPAVRRDAGATTDLREAQKRYQTPNYAALPELIRQVEARGWLWEGGHIEHKDDERGRVYAHIWLANLDPMHYDEPADERWGYGETLEVATRQATEMLPPNPYKE